MTPPSPSTGELATFGAGCFWGVEETFRKIPGVLETVVGYEGGTLKNSRYEDVCTDRTGHAEVVQVRFDPSQVRYEDLLEVFWSNHNPTTVNRQGPDIGTQYRSVIFTHSDEQWKIAEKSKAAQDLFGTWEKPIVTEIVPATTFYRAEEYHQKYLQKGGMEACSV